MSIVLNSRSLVIYLLIGILISCSKDDFSWNLKKLPEVGYLSIKSNDTEKFILETDCLSIGYDDKVEMGFCWSLNENPTINDNVIHVSQNTKGKYTDSVFWSSIANYYFRAYVKNSIGIVYSQNCFVSWPGVSSLPIVQTLSVNQISFYSFNVHSKVVSTGTPVIEKGVQLFDASNNLIQTINSNSTSNDYYSAFDGLNDGSTYYVRAFAKTLFGTTADGNLLTVNLPQKYNIGDTGPSGGLVFYENPDIYGSWHYLEAAPYDIGTFIWSPQLNATNITSLDLGSGYSNSNSLISILGSGQNYAAGVVNTWISSSGFSDWFLPSFYELKLMKEQIFNQGLGNFQSGSAYWSSSEDSSHSMNAWTVKMSLTGQNIYTTLTKNQAFRVRAIRRI
jgi:hypothetical protein